MSERDPSAGPRSASVAQLLSCRTEYHARPPRLPWKSIKSFFFNRISLSDGRECLHKAVHQLRA
jgi:hypothetical protein